jgi:carboxylesterase
MTPTLHLDPFFFPGGPVGCLLLHGFSNSPHEMRPLGEYLAAQGLTVLGARLAGHGTTPEDLEGKRWPDWAASAADGLAELRRSCPQVFVVGISGGGLVALYLATTAPLDGLVVMSVPVLVSDWRWRLLPIAQHFVRWVRDTRCDLTDPTAKATYYSHPATYERKPVAALVSMGELQAIVRRRLPQITVPTLLIYGRCDRTISPGDADYLLAHLGSPDKQLVWFANSGHGLVVDSEKEKVWARVHGWVVERSQRV